MMRKIKRWLFLKVVFRLIERKVAKHDNFELHKILIFMYGQIVFNNYDLRLQYRAYRIVSKYLLS